MLRYGRTATAVAFHPSRALGKAGAHPVAALNRLLEARTERVREVSRFPKSAAARPGPRIHGVTPAAAVRASANSRLVSGWSSTTLYTPAGAPSAAATAVPASARWIDDW